MFISHLAAAFPGDFPAPCKKAASPRLGPEFFMAKKFIQPALFLERAVLTRSAGS
jgi:hypothetical protein